MHLHIDIIIKNSDIKHRNNGYMEQPHSTERVWGCFFGMVCVHDII
jgi:hypothetical protein